MADRHEHRRCYIEGWYELDAEKLLRSVSDGFVFDDPAEAVPITKSTLAQYVNDWTARVNAAGATGEWELSDVVNVDANGVLICWEWWKVVGTTLEGAAVVKTSDQGVFCERIVYFERGGPGATVSD